MKTVFVFLMICLLLAVNTASNADLPPGWSLTILHPEGDHKENVCGISSTQQAGYYYSSSTDGEYHACIWDGTPESFFDLHDPAWIYSQAFDMYGTQIIGKVQIADSGQIHAVMWDSADGSYIDLNPTGCNYSLANGTNGTLQVGRAKGGPMVGGVYCATVWNGAPDDYTVIHPEGWFDSFATDIWGDKIVGYGTCLYGDPFHAIYWDGIDAEAFVDLHPEGWDGSIAWDVWGSQQAGYVRAGSIGITEINIYHAALWEGTAESFVDLNPEGWDYSQCEGIWGTKQVGSAYVSAEEKYYHAALWEGTAESFFDLNDIVPSEYIQSDAYVINRYGGLLVIGGRGRTIDHQAHALLWTYQEPKPEVLITSPTGTDTYEVIAELLSVAGEAYPSYEEGILSVSWTNDRGGSGYCSGTDTWSADGITLQSGVNAITVTVTDSSAQQDTDTLTVTYNPIPPTATITGPSASSTNTGPVTYNVTWSEPVTGFTAEDIDLNATGTADAAVGITGSEDSYTVTLYPCTGDGTLGITIPAGCCVDTTDEQNLAAGPSDTFTVDNTGTSCTIGDPSASSTNTGPVTYSLTWNEPVTGFTAEDVTLNATGTADAAVDLSGSEDAYTVTLSSCTGDGTLGITIPAGCCIDSVENPNAAAGPSGTFTVDSTGPSAEIGEPSHTSTGGRQVTFDVIWDEPVTGFIDDDITYESTGTASVVIDLYGSGDTYLMIIRYCNGNGTVTLNIPAGCCEDSLGNPSQASGPSQTIIIDTIPPSATIGPPSESATTTGPVTFEVTWSEPVTGFAASDIDIYLTGSAYGDIGLSGSGDSYTVTFSSCTGEGLLGFNVPGAICVDSAGNYSLIVGQSQTFVVDQAACCPADANSDWRINISEMTGYGAAWKTGQDWTVPPNPIPIEYVTRAGYLWKNGEAYHFAPGETEPTCWASGAESRAAGSTRPAVGPNIERSRPGGLASSKIYVHNDGSQRNLKITLAVSPSSGVTNYAVQERIPAHWKVSQISGGGVYDPARNSIRWGPFFDDCSRNLSYTLTPPRGKSRSEQLLGTASFDGVNVSVGGKRIAEAVGNSKKLSRTGKRLICTEEPPLWFYY